MAACMEQGQQYYPRRERVRSRRKVLQTCQKNNIHKGLSGGSPSESKVCFLCGQAGHVCKDCSQLQQAVSSLAPQNPQKLVRYPAQSYTSVQLLPVESQPQQSTNRAPMPQKSRCGPVGRGQVFRVTGGEAMEERVNAVINGKVLLFNREIRIPIDTDVPHGFIYALFCKNIVINTRDSGATIA